MYELAQPVVQTSIVSIQKFEVVNVAIIPFQSASVTILCYDANGVFVTTKNFVLSGNDYLNWGNNDAYLDNYIASHLA
jgi:hypothetical protein